MAVLTCGCENWAIERSGRRKIATAQKARSIMEYRNKTVSANEKKKEWKSRWYQHAMRMDEERLPKRIR
jgi:hypothetical protein